VKWDGISRSDSRDSVPHKFKFQSLYERVTKEVSVRVESLRKHYYAGSQHEAGTTYEATAADAKVLVASKTVRLVDNGAPKSEVVVKPRAVKIEKPTVTAQKDLTANPKKKKKDKKTGAPSRAGTYTRRDMRAEDPARED